MGLGQAGSFTPPRCSPTAPSWTFYRTETPRRPPPPLTSSIRTICPSSPRCGLARPKPVAKKAATSHYRASALPSAGPIQFQFSSYEIL